MRIVMFNREKRMKQLRANIRATTIERKKLLDEQREYRVELDSYKMRK